VLPDTPLDKTAQFFNQSMMSARVVEHHDRAMLNVVKPSLSWYKSVFAEFWPDWSVIPVSRNVVTVVNWGVHAEVLGLVARIQLITFQKSLGAPW